MSEAAVFSAVALSVVFTIAAVGKLRAPERFALALGSYPFIPGRALRPLVVVVPLVELTLVGLLWAAPQPGAAVATGSVLAVFTALLVAALLSGSQAECGCFGSARVQKVTWISVARNFMLIGVAVVPVASRAGTPPPEAADHLAAALAGLGMALIVLVIDQVGSLFAQDGSTTRVRT